MLLAPTGLEIGGGIAGVARCMARAFDELVAAGRLEAADRISLQDDPAAPPPPPARGAQRLSGDRQALFAWQLWSHLRRHPDALVVFDQPGLARSARIPLPGLPPRRYAIFCHGIELDRIHRGLRRRALVGAWRLLANSEHTGAVLGRRFPEAADRIRVARLCIDPERVAAWEARRRGAPPRPRRTAVLIVGRMWAEEPGKGHDELIEAWPRVRARIPEAELWVAGEGDDRARLERRAAELAPPGSVRFLGRVSDAELGDLYAEAALFSMPSCQEGFGLVYAEAMWHGLPCIGSTADAAAEVVEHGETGLLVPYGDPAALADAVASLLEDPARRLRLGRRAAERARERFVYERFRDELLKGLDLPGV